ncbi:MAG TPA: hypothetical protein VGB14_15205 [Acidimicrobiales bacterium]
MTVVAYVPDLMDRSKVRAAAPGARWARDGGALADGTGPGDVVVADLSRPGAVEGLAAAAAAGARTIGFGSHVDRATLDAARAAGVGEVMARSEFFRRLPGLLGGEPGAGPAGP